MKQVQEVHVRIACPEIKFPDFYGVDMPTKEGIISLKKIIMKMCSYINAKKFKVF